MKKIVSGMFLAGTMLLASNALANAQTQPGGGVACAANAPRSSYPSRPHACDTYRDQYGYWRCYASVNERNNAVARGFCHSPTTLR